MRRDYLKRRIKRLGGGLLCTMLAGGCGTAAAEVPTLIEPVSPGIETAQVTRQDVYEVAYYESAVIPEMTELSFPEGGIIDKLDAYIGMEVKADDILGTLEGTSAAYEALCEQQEQKEADNSYNNELAQLKIEHARLENELYGTDNDIDRQLLVQRQQEELQQLESDYTEREIRRLQEHLSDGYLCAPEDGVIAAMADLRSGSYVTEDTVVLALANPSSQYVMCDYISSQTIAACDRMYALIGDKEYELEYIPIDDTELSAIRMNEEDAYSTFRVIDGEETLVGKYAVICLIYNKVEDVLAVPNTALFSDEDGQYVYRMDGENRSRVNVTTGVKGAQYAQIKEGLSEGNCVYVQERAISSNYNTVTLDYQTFSVSASVGVDVYYPVQTPAYYTCEYGAAVYGEWLVVKGDEVTEGQPIMEITIPVDEIAQKELELKEERLKREQKETEENARSSEKAKKAAIAAAAGTEKELLENELEQLELENERAISAAKENLAAVSEQLELAEAAKEQTQILAPCDGTIMYLESYRKDDRINPQTAVAWIYNTDEALYDFADKAGVTRYGQKVTISDMMKNSYDAAIVSGSIPGMDESLLRQDAVLTCLDEIEAAKRYGLEVSYEVVDLDHVLVVPAEALYTDQYGSYVVEAVDGGTRRRYFTAGKTVNGSCLAIDGLEAGLTLATE